MNIGFYGHSMAQWERQQPFSYITKIKDHFDATIINCAAPMGSEERILFNLKKTKNLDLAIVFHSSPDFIFVPSEKRDFCSVDRDTLIEKVPSGRVKEWFKLNGYENVPDDLCEFWEKIPNMPCFELLKTFSVAPQFWEKDVSTFDGEKRRAFIEWCAGNQDVVKNLMKEKEEFKNEIEYFLGLFDALNLNKKYLYHHDLQMNRYYGALIQIDQYLSFKNIPVVHCLGKPWWYPNWFRFTSGVTDSEIYKLQHEVTGHYATVKESDNNMNEEGNRIAFELIMPLIKLAITKVQ